MKAFLRSLQVEGERGERHVFGEVDEIRAVESGGYMATISGKHYSAVFNPFSGAYFVDDVDGELIERSQSI